MLTFDTNRLGEVTQRKFNACWRELECDCRDFIAVSADAGEHLAKAMLIALDIDPERKHDIKALARQAREAGHVREAEAIQALNGSSTKKDHIASYEPKEVIIDRAENATRRLAKTLPLYRQLAESLPLAVPASEREALKQDVCNLCNDIEQRLNEFYAAKSDQRNATAQGFLKPVKMLIDNARQSRAEIEGAIT